MKHKFLLLLLIFSFSTYAQLNQPKLIAENGENIANGNWQESDSVSYKYDSLGFVSEITKYLWNNGWKPLSLITLVNDTSGKKLVETQLHWKGNTWAIDSHTLYSYNAQDLLILKSYETYDSLTANFKSTRQLTFTYNISGKIDTQLHQFWINNNWINAELTTYNYSGVNSDTTLVQSWNDANNSWYPRYEETNIYDNTQNLISKTFKVPRSTGPQSFSLFNDTRYLYNYTNLNKYDTLVYQVWDGLNWMNRSKNIRNFTNDILDTAISQSWVDTIWLNSSKTTLQYNSFDSVFLRTFYKWTAGSWNVSGLRTYYYEVSPSVDILEKFLEDEKVFLYPTPFSNELNVVVSSETEDAGAQLTVYNMLGQLVTKRDIKLNTGFNLFTFTTVDFQEGAYVYLFKTKSGKAYGKLLKQ